VPLYQAHLPGEVRWTRSSADNALEPLQFDAIYGHYFDRVISIGGKQILKLSVKRYVAAVNGAYNND
jgi:hypothetical protein